MLYDFPNTMRDPMVPFHNLIEENARYSREWLYVSDLEKDFLRVLGEIQKAAKENPIEVEADYSKLAA